MNKENLIGIILMCGLMGLALMPAACADDDDNDSSGDSDTDSDSDSDTDADDCESPEWGPASGISIGSKIGNWEFTGYYDANANWVIDEDEKVETTFTMEDIYCNSGAQSLVILLSDLQCPNCSPYFEQILLGTDGVMSDDDLELILQGKDSIILMAVTTGIGSGTITAEQAGNYSEDFIRGAYYSNTPLLAKTGSGGVPFGFVVDLETLEVIEMEPTGDGYVTLSDSEIYLAALDAYNN